MTTVESRLYSSSCDKREQTERYTSIQTMTMTNKPTYVKEKDENTSMIIDTWIMNYTSIDSIETLYTSLSNSMIE